MNVMTYRKLKCALCAAALCGTFAYAQEAKTCFVNMPDSLSPLLTAVNRADCVDFLASDMKAQVTNTLGGKSEMTELTADYIRIQTTEQSSWQMKLLPLNDSTKVICVVQTACAPACDSHFKFYTTGWHELPAQDYLPATPAIADFIAEAADTTDVYEYQDARRQADLPLFKAELSKDDTSLTFILATPDYMAKDAAEKLRPYILPALTYAWRDGQFRKP